MSFFYRCDRCGAEVVPDDRRYILDVNAHGRHPEFGEVCGMDLCSRCRGELEEWLHAYEKEERDD